jgi:CheY-like chemotaxis protein
MVAVTAHALPGDRQRFLDLGFDAYVAKPFAPADLRRQVKQVVAARSATPAFSG